MAEYDRAKSELMFKMVGGTRKSWVAIEWLLAGPDDGIDSPMLSEARRAALALPKDMNTLVRGLINAWEHHDRAEADAFREMSYELLIVRDLLDDLDEQGHRLFDEVPVRQALIAFDDGLDDADWWIHQIEDEDGEDELESRRVEMGERPGKEGRRWWMPITLLPPDMVEDPLEEFRQLVADARGVPIEKVPKIEWGTEGEEDEDPPETE